MLFQFTNDLFAFSLKESFYSLPGKLINCLYSFSARARSFSNVKPRLAIVNSSSVRCNVVLSRTIHKHSRSQSAFFISSCIDESMNRKQNVELLLFENKTFT